MAGRAGRVVVRRVRVGRHRARRPRAQILAGFCDVALVVGADTTPKGFLAPNAGERGDDPDWLRFRLLGATNPTYFGLYARRRMDLYGATADDFAAVKVKNSRHGLANPNAVPARGLDRRRPHLADRRRPAAPPRHLRDQRRRGGARGHEPRLRARARSRVAGEDRRDLDGDTELSQPRHRAAELRDRLGCGHRHAALGGGVAFKDSIADRAYAEAGIGPDDLDLAEVYDLSTALELDWYEHIGLCPPGEAEKLLRDGETTIGGRIPVNASGGLACFGEAVPAQAIAQVCELTWQLRGECGDRQVDGARVGLSVNQGLFGHGSAVVVTR